MTYYDIKTSILVTVVDGKIISIERKPRFCFDQKIEMTDVEKLFYGRIGTAYHSGKKVTQTANYLGTKAIINYATSIRTGTVRHYSVCDKSPDKEDFLRENIFPFFTNDVDIMPVLGYVVVNGKIKEPNGSLFERPCLLEGDAAITVMENLDGDNIGQMVQLLKDGKPVYNSVYETVFSNPFYGCTLSLLPIKEMDSNTVVMPWDSFYSYFKGLGATVSELTKSIPVELNCDKEIFGFDKINVYTGTQPDLLSGFFGFLRYFTNAQVDFVYSYRGRYSDIVCGFDKVVVEKTRQKNQ